MEARMELLATLAEAEEDVKNDRVAPISLNRAMESVFPV